LQHGVKNSFKKNAIKVCLSLRYLYFSTVGKRRKGTERHGSTSKQIQYSEENLKTKIVGKKINKDLLPVKKWLSLSETLTYLDMGKDKFLEIAADNALPHSLLGVTKYYRVVELDCLFEKNITLKQTV
jgi:hypothetical protein